MKFPVLMLIMVSAFMNPLYARVEDSKNGNKKNGLSLKDLSLTHSSDQISQPDNASLQPPQMPGAIGKAVICKFPLGTRDKSFPSTSESMTFIVSDQDGYRACSEKGGEISVATKNAERNGMDIKGATASGR